MNFILFGPPGIGKSTLIGVLKSMHYRAIDLEDVYPSRIRFQVPNLVDNAFLGGADLNPKRNYNNAKKILLMLETQKAYDERRKLRDQRYPEKASQQEHMLKDWLDAKYDIVFRLYPNESPQTSATRLIKKLEVNYGSIERN